MGLAIQIHCIPHYAVEIGELAAKFPKTPVILDHLARAGQGTPEEFDQVLKLAKMPQVYMKYSSTGVETVSKEPYPHADAKPVVKRVYEAFGADRMMWGGLGTNMAEFAREVKLFDLMFDFAPEAERAKIRGLTAQQIIQVFVRRLPDRGARLATSSGSPPRELQVRLIFSRHAKWMTLAHGKPGHGWRTWTGLTPVTSVFK